jgi:hypothetical protein
MSPVSVHRETIGAALAVRSFGAMTFGQGTNPSGIISGFDIGNEEYEKTLKERFKEYEGIGNAHKVMYIPGDGKFYRAGLPPQDAQYLETRKFDIAEIARIYGVPLHMLKEHDKSNSWAAGLLELNTEFVTYTMQPLCTAWEHEINTKLLGDDDRYYCKFTMDSLLRGNSKERSRSCDIACCTRTRRYRHIRRHDEDHRKRKPKRIRHGQIQLTLSFRVRSLFLNFTMRLCLLLLTYAVTHILLRHPLLSLLRAIIDMFCTVVYWFQAQYGLFRFAYLHFLR